MVRDVFGAVRFLRRKPIFSLSVILTLGLGLAANAGAFAVVYGLLLRPLPFADPESLVLVWSRDVAQGTGNLTSSPAEYYDLGEQTESLEAVAAVATSEINLRIGERTVRRSAGVVTAEFLDTLGVRPLVGRPFRPDDFRKGGLRGILLDEEFWREQYGADPAALGRTVLISGVEFEILGVLPTEARLNQQVDLWMPLAITQSEASRVARFLLVIGRIGDGYSQSQVDAEVRAVARRLSTTYPDTNKQRSFYVEPLDEALASDSQAVLLALLAASGALLLLAAINTLHLVFVRVTNHRRELALRLAVGATRGLVGRRLVVETVLLCLAASVLGLLGGAVAIDLAERLELIMLPGAHRIALGWEGVLYVLCVSVLLGAVLGLLAALRAPKLTLVQALTAAEDVDPGRVRSATAKKALLVAQVAIAFVLVVTAGAMLRHLRGLTATDLGFETENLRLLSLVYPSSEYPPGSPQLQSHLERALASLEELPQVADAASAIFGPLADGAIRRNVTVAEVGREPQDVETLVQPVSPAYFETLGIRMVRGQSPRVGDRRAVVVNRQFADLYLPAGAVGEELVLHSPFHPEPSRLEVVGVVESVRRAHMRDATTPGIYVPHELELMPFATLFVRTTHEAPGVGEMIQRTVSRVDPAVAVEEATRFDRIVRKSVQRERTIAWLLGTLGVLALLVASVGIYGLVALLVSSRTREFGIRFSLGAKREELVVEVLFGSLRLTILGVLLGLVLCVPIALGYSTLALDVELLQPVTILLVAFLLVAVSAAAALVPALRASRVPPVVAMRIG